MKGSEWPRVGKKAACLVPLLRASSTALAEVTGASGSRWHLHPATSGDGREGAKGHPPPPQGTGASSLERSAGGTDSLLNCGARAARRGVEDGPQTPMLSSHENFE